jgi:PAS domain S-box-containing protein
MILREITQLVEGTFDPAFAVDGLGIIAAWNHAATEMFGVSAAETIGKPCSEVIRGADECGAVCSRNCIVKQSAGKHQLMRNFDLRINTPKGRK